MPPVPTKFDGPVKKLFQERTGKPLSPQTLARLRLSQKLPMWFVMGTWQTTREHVADFIQRQTEMRLPKPQGDDAADAARSPATARRLEAAGLLPAGAGS